ncbi:MAG: tRNA (N6-isopentenyl adenosine(37)-C2)-methylthiotransferase MiaB [Desulfobulbaceae bacterium]|nr:tRNA (N6-isopentenyl adenosine(37)-C2)-methylthiotransferase MiaB [Desulfobulbaceae bacterium]
MRERFLYIKTFGCQMNERDSEIIEHLLYPVGFLPVAEMGRADLVVINTCSIRAKAEQKVYSLLGQLRQNKSRNPALLICVAGCVAQQEGKIIQQRMPHVDIVVGTQQIYQLPEMIRKLDRGTVEPMLAVNLDSSFAIPAFQDYHYQEKKPSCSPSPAPDFKKFVTIMQGCNNFCSYCVVPYTRGREISRPVADILDEIRVLLARGVSEITLLGQNVNSYGQTNSVVDHGSVHFADLLRQVAALPGLKRLRFTTSNPKDLSDALMRCFAEIENLCPQFHLPVQSGSDRVLKRMNRNYTVAGYLLKVRTLRSYQPDLALSTDIIVGFPGETDEDFAATMELLQTVQYHSSFSFKYSDRPGTRSAGFDHKVDEKVKSERLARFQALQDSVSLERNRAYVGRIMEVTVEGKGKNNMLYGRTTTNHIVHFPASGMDRIRPGDALQVRINLAGQHSLTGKITGEQYHD